MPKLKVNNNEIEFDQGMTVLQACEIAGEEIPRFCYHERLKIAGNCRMCLVQIAGGPPKPAASCAMPAAEGMEVFTNTEMVKNAREGVMEFLLANHPLDCPICDQGGECDLQDQAMQYGRAESCFDESKRAVKEKNFGPLIKTQMTRCIHCTRCVRFLEDVAGTQELGAINRGENMEISTFIQESLSSELSGNIVDLCPVGALTSKPYAFNARPWELNKTESIDVLDAVGSNIRIDSRGNKVFRILPRLNEEINEEWISDKTRYSYDALSLQRLDRPYVRRDGKFEDSSLEEIFKIISEKVKSINPENIATIAGDFTDCETMLAMKRLFKEIGSGNIECRQDDMLLDSSDRASYLFNTTISGIEESDLCLIIGANLRKDAAIINARLRKSQVQKGTEVAYIGSKIEFNQKVDFLGDDPVVLEQILSGAHGFSKKLKSAKNPIIIIGYDALLRKDAKEILSITRKISETYGVISENKNNLNILHRSASRVGGLDIGFIPSDKKINCSKILESAEKGEIKLLYLLGADEINFKKSKDCLVIYQGSHGDKGAHLADIIIPSSAYTEKSATYVNTEGRVQITKKAVSSPNNVKDDYEIILELSKFLGNDNYLDLSDIRKNLSELNESFNNIGYVSSEKWGKIDRVGKLDHTKFTKSNVNFYQNNSISRSSKIMAECASEILKEEK